MDPMQAYVMAAAVTVVAFVVFTLIFRWIWNRTVPAVFGLKEITFWQAVGILILASILFGGHRVVSTDYAGLPKRAAAPAMVTQPA